MSFICFDTEDDSEELMKSGRSGFDKTVTQIAAITASGDTFYNKGDTVEFRDWVKHRKEKYVYAHNVQYDLGNIFGDDLTPLDTTMIGGRVIRSVHGVKHYMDTFNLWPMSAAKIGEAFGLEKLKTNDMASDKAYVFRDVEIIREALLFVERFCAKMDIATMPATLGGMAIKVWKALGGVNCHDSMELSRKAYFGGRVELFKKVNESEFVAYADINSLYPSVMMKDFPGALGEVDDIPQHGIVRVKVKIPKMDFGVLPFRRADGRIFYPWGTFEGTFAAPELHAAIARGVKVLKFHQAFGSDETSKPYQYYVTKLYRDRLESTSDAEKLFFKLLLNNLYGRLGTSGTISRTCWIRNGQQMPSDKVLCQYDMPLSAETNWCHAAYVTAYGRIALLEHIERIGFERMIYTDTDSVIFDCPDKLLPFPLSNELGAMKLEKRCESCGDFFSKKCCGNPVATDFWNACATYAPKMYNIGNAYKAKGVPKRLQKFFIEHGHAEYDLPFKMREAIRFFDKANARKLSIWRRVRKENRQNYDRKNLVGNRYLACNVSKLQ